MHPALSPYVLGIDESLSETAGTYTVLPAPAVVLGIQFRGQLHLQDEFGLQPLASSGLTGLCRGPRLFHSSAEVGSVLVRFSVAGASALLGIPGAEFVEQSLPLAQLLTPSFAAELEERVAAAPTAKSRQFIVNEMLTRLFAHATTPDVVVSAALRVLHQQCGTSRISALAQDLGVSQNQLERRFRRVVGLGPKQYADLLRFRAALGVLQRGGHWADAALPLGFYDQAHFIRHFAAYTGQTPTAFLSPPSMG